MGCADIILDLVSTGAVLGLQNPAAAGVLTGSRW